METDETAAMQRELEAVLKKYGVRSPAPYLGDMSPADFQKVRKLAMHIVHGNIDPGELSALNEKLKTNLDAFVKHLIGLRMRPGLKGLEERNPYYSAFGSAIVRDNAQTREE